MDRRDFVNTSAIATIAAFAAGYDTTTNASPEPRTTEEAFVAKAVQEPFWIQGSESFPTGYHSEQPYKLIPVGELDGHVALTPSDRITFIATSIFIGDKGWAASNNSGVLGFKLSLVKPIPYAGIPDWIHSEAPQSLDYSMTFKNANRGGHPDWPGDRTLFNSVDAEYLLDTSLPTRVLDIDIDLRKSEGGQESPFWQVFDGIDKDDTLKQGISAVPFFGIASSLIRLLKGIFFRSSDAREMWTSAGRSRLPLAHFGRFVFHDLDMPPSSISAEVRYRDERLVHYKTGQPMISNQFFLDIRKA